MDNSAMIRALMAGLVARAGGVDAAAALISAHVGREVGKGSVSKRMAGHLEWPLAEIMALEDAVGDPCVRRWLARGLGDGLRGEALIAAVARVAQEHGEALSASMALSAGVGSRAVALREAMEAHDALSVLITTLSGGGDAAD